MNADIERCPPIDVVEAIRADERAKYAATLNELEALAVLDAELGKLGRAAQKRVMRWTVDKFRPRTALPIGPNHALLVGLVAGACTGIDNADVQLLDDAEGNHAAEFLIDRPSGIWRVSVRPERVKEP
jgi:hypothetical protein